jgi:excisionase family DNA binding protein
LGKNLDAKERHVNLTTHLDDGDLPRRLLNITELAELLGVNIRHVRRLVAERRIPFIKWGHLIRFDPDEVGRWIDAYRRRPDRSA